MRFKEFLAKEDANSSEIGLMIRDKKRQGHRVPSEGHPFGIKMSSFGPGESQGSAPMGGAMMMRKKMRKKMKTT